MTFIRPREFSFETLLRWKQGCEIVAQAANRTDIVVSCPPVFGGDQDDLWTPEHLFLSAVETCIFETFRYLSERSGLKFSGYGSRAVGTVRMQGGTFRFAEVRVYPEVIVEDERNAEKARLIMKRAKERCLISRSLLTPVVVEAVISSEKGEVPSS